METFFDASSVTVKKTLRLDIFLLCRSEYRIIFPLFCSCVREWWSRRIAHPNRYNDADYCTRSPLVREFLAIVQSGFFCIACRIYRDAPDRGWSLILHCTSETYSVALKLWKAAVVDLHRECFTRAVLLPASLCSRIAISGQSHTWSISSDCNLSNESPPSDGSWLIDG